MSRVYLKNGKFSDILSEDDFSELLRDELGDDAEEMYKTILFDAKSESEFSMREEDNAEADSWRNYAIDVWHELQEIVYAKRINRNKLLALTERMENDL